MCHGIFSPDFSWFNPIWAPDKRVKNIFELGFDFAEKKKRQVIQDIANAEVSSGSLLKKQSGKIFLRVKFSNFLIEYHGEIKTEIENIYALLSGFES